MTKADIVDTIFEQFGYSKKDVAEVVDTVFETLKGDTGAGGEG